MHLFHDTPDYYNTATMSRYWNTVHADAIVDANDGYGGGGALSASSANGYAIRYHDQSSQSSFAVGMRFKCTAAPGASKVILAVVDAAGAIQCAVVQKTTGKLAIYRGNISAQLGSDTDEDYATSTQLDIGFKGTVASAGGSVELWVGTAGDPDSWTRVIAVSNENTAGGTGEFWRGLYIGMTTTTFSSHVYAGLTDLVHGFYVTAKYPSATGVFTGYAANTGTVAAALDDTTPDDDTTYVACSASDAPFTVSVGTMPTTTRTILAVETIAVVENTTDGAALTYTPICVTDASGDAHVHEGTWHAMTDSTYRVARQVLQVNPDTNLPWTVDELNDAEFGGYATT